MVQWKAESSGLKFKYKEVMNILEVTLKTAFYYFVSREVLSN